MTSGILAFGIALMASLLLTVPVRQLALRVGMFDHLALASAPTKSVCA